MGMVDRILALALAGIAAWALAGCGTNPDAALRESERQVFARGLFETAAQAAVAKPGIRVCRMLTTGIAEQEWIKGVVIEADAGLLKLRIDEPGRLPHFLNGVSIAAGSVVLDKPTLWTPCL